MNIPRLLRMVLPLLSLLLFTSVCQQTVAMTVKEGLITNEAQCNYTHNMDPDTEYRIKMGLNQSSCDGYNDERKGFYCDITFQQRDIVTLLGYRLCVDVQGVAKTMPNTQLLIKAFDGPEVLQLVYTVTALLPEDTPYYVCAKEFHTAITVAVTVYKSVPICKLYEKSPVTIMDSMVGHNISFGTFSMQQLLPVYKLSMTEDCSSHTHVMERIHILKISSSGHRNRCDLHIPAPPVFTHTNACIEIQYVEPQYRCQITVQLSDSLAEKEPLISFDVQDGRSFQSRTKCASYSNTNDADHAEPVLLILKEATEPCLGRFALKVSYLQDDDETHDHGDVEAVDTMRQLYMAVFISLISVCLLILGLTCVCCLRVRAKRLGISRRRSASARSSRQNPGFETAPSYPIPSWHQSSPEQVFGLPTYEEVQSQDTEGINSTQDQTKDKPPAYDSLYPTSS